MKERLKTEMSEKEAEVKRLLECVQVPWLYFQFLLEQNCSPDIRQMRVTLWHTFQLGA